MDPATSIVQGADTATNATDRVFHVKPGAEVIFRDLTIQHGNAMTNPGGGILNEGDRLSLIRVWVLDNRASAGGGVSNAGPLTVQESQIAFNRANGIGGGIFNTGAIILEDSQINNNVALTGGGLHNLGTASLTASQVNANIAQANFGVTGGGIVNSNGQLTLLNSSVEGNQVAIFDNMVSTNGGGGIYHTAGQLTIRGSSITDNALQGNQDFLDGGGPLLGGGEVLILDSVIKDNFVGGSSNSGGGMGVSSSGIIRIDGTTIEANQAASGAGLVLAGLGEIRVTNSTISGNMSTNIGGGIYATGQDIHLVNVTVSGNQANHDGGGLLVGSFALVSLSNVTISANTADLDADGSGHGGGIFTSTGSVNLKNSLVAGNFDLSPGLFTSAPDCRGTLTSAGYNLIGTLGLAINGTHCVVDGDDTGNLIGGDADLGPLQDNDGLTWTHALGSGSEAINAGDLAGCEDEAGSPLLYDQRRGFRLDRCDMGAFELGALLEHLFLPLIQKP